MCHLALHGILLLVWVGAPSCYLDMLHSLLKWICGTVAPVFVVSL